MKLFVKAVLPVCIFFVVVHVALAQQVPENMIDEQVAIEPTTFPVTPTPNIEEAVDNSAAIADRQNDYFRLLEQYRNQEQAFEVARAQYLQLNTLASQELAVKEARQLLSTRADIFLTYLQLIELNLEQTTGIPLENKKAQLVGLTLLQEQVKVHKNTVLNASDRINLDQESSNFKDMIKLIQQQSYYSISLIRLGKLQTSYDKLLVLRSAVESEMIERKLSAGALAEKQRGLDEIDRTIELTNQDMAILREAVFIKRQINSVGQLSSLSQSLSKPYSQIRQAMTFLQEIRK